VGDERFDVVVVGAGLSGITTALLAAKLGRRVALVESRSRPGGVTRSYVRGGVDCPVGVHYFGAAGRGELLDCVWKALGLDVPLQPMGVGGPLSIIHLPEGVFELPVGFEALEATLNAWAPRETGAVRSVIESLQVAAEPLKLARPRAAGHPAVQPALDTLREAGCSQRLISALSVPEAWLGMRLADCPSVAFEMALASYMLSSWRLGCSGAQLVDQCVERFAELGGELVVGDGVERLLLADGRAVGVELGSGRRLGASVVVMSVHPKRVVQMFPPDAGLAPLDQKISSLPESAAATMGFALVDSTQTPPRPHNTYVFGERERTWFQVRSTSRPGRSLLCVVAVDEVHRWNDWAQTRIGERGEDYLAAKHRRAEQMLTVIRQVTPVGSVEWLDVLSPLSFRDWVSGWDGSLYGIARGGLMLAGLNRCGVPGLRFVGQSLMAPGVVGVTFGALRVVGDIVGRHAVAKLLEESS